MYSRHVLIGVCLMLCSGAASALIEEIFVRLEFGLLYDPGDGALLTLDGPAWSVDNRVTFVTESEGTFLKVVFTGNSAGLPAGVAAYPASLAPNPKINCLSGFADCANALAFIVISGPPSDPNEVRKYLIEAIPEPSTLMFFVAAIAALPLLRRRMRSSGLLRGKSRSAGT